MPLLPLFALLILTLDLLLVKSAHCSEATKATACFSSPTSHGATAIMKRVLVIGGNGKTGKRVVRLLRDSPLYHPVAMIRSVDQKPSFDEMGVQSVLGDLRYPIDHLLRGIDVVVFAAGGRTSNEKGKEGTVAIDLAGAILAISASQASDDVSRFVMLSGTNVGFETTSKITHWHRAKAYADTFLRDSATFGRALDWTIVCPATLHDDPLPNAAETASSGVAMGVDEALKAPAIVHSKMDVGPGAVGNSSRDLVAAALVGVIDMPNTHGKTFLLLDEEVKPGRTAFTIDGVSPEPRPLGEALASL